MAEDEEDQEDMGDIDLWTVSPGSGNLQVNGRWLKHLQQRLLGDDGHPRRTKVSGGAPSLLMI